MTYRTSHQRQTLSTRLADADPAQFRKGDAVIYTPTHVRGTVAGRSWNGQTWKYTFYTKDGARLRVTEAELVPAR